jgi:hypothetical protein
MSDFGYDTLPLAIGFTFGTLFGAFITWLLT